ncbi:PRTRC system protein E [Paraburkholderia phenazinium]|uniref:PRTRC system protein E n=1 Tax=Paraburkholderia phenazinium TaxID=60549 RepID=UPI001589AFEB|nr:PRTRC system protein E [Paraburkholderia phenazinium]
MFQQLEAFVRETGKVTLTLKMTGDLMAVVVMPAGDSKEAALRQPMVLTATPAEFDEGFAQSLQTYETAHRSLAEQVSATTEILKAAERSHAGNALKVLSKGSKPALSAPASRSDDDEDANEAGEDSTAPTTSASGAAKAVPAAAGDGKTDLFALL